MKQWLKLSVPAVALALCVANANAAFITGSLNFEGGTVTLDTPGASGATAITAFGGNTVVANDFGVMPTGNFAGTAGDAVTFIATGFQFSPVLSPNPVVPLWTFTTLGGITYSFDLTSVVSSVGVGGALNLSGTGTLHETNFQDTQATWNLSDTGNGPSIFGFVASNNAIPDGGTTLTLLGGALAGLGLIKRKLAA